MTLGGKFLNLKVPIAVQDFDITGTLRIDGHLFRDFSSSHFLSYAFVSPPAIEVAIKPIYAIDLMDIPFINEWIVESLRGAVKNTMVLPRMIDIPLGKSQTGKFLSFLRNCSSKSLNWANL